MDQLCSISKKCGGCSQIDVPYDQQLAEKQAAIEALFAPLIESGGAAQSGTEAPSPIGSSPLVRPILGMDEPWHYRTKIVSPFAPAKKKHSLRSLARTGRAGKLALRREDILCGMYAAGTHQIIECEECPVEHPVGRRVVTAVRQIMARYGMAPYNEDTGAGFVRHVVVRVGAQSGEVLVTLVTNGREFTGSKNFCKELVRQVPEVTTVVQNINTRQTNVIFGEEEQVLYGPGFILDTLCGLSFRISSNSFFQVNARQTEVLYSSAIALALGAEGVAPSRASSSEAGARDGGLQNLARMSPTILDAYCGTGTIGLVAAAAVPGVQVIGVDSTEAAIADARQNATHNGIENARFIAQDAGEFMEGYALLGGTVDVVFMDPPRSGASPEFLQALIKLAPKRIVYISCNPETQVRDASMLIEAGYSIEAVQPVDMFPHTPHVETVVSMTRRKS